MPVPHCVSGNGKCEESSYVWIGCATIFAESSFLKQTNQSTPSLQQHHPSSASSLRVKSTSVGSQYFSPWAPVRLTWRSNVWVRWGDGEWGGLDPRSGNETSKGLIRPYFWGWGTLGGGDQP